MQIKKLTPEELYQLGEDYYDGKNGKAKDIANEKAVLIDMCKHEKDNDADELLKIIYKKPNAKYGLDMENISVIMAVSQIENDFIFKIYAIDRIVKHGALNIGIVKKKLVETLFLKFQMLEYTSKDFDNDYRGIFETLYKNQNLEFETEGEPVNVTINVKLFSRLSFSFDILDIAAYTNTKLDKVNLIKCIANAMKDK